MASSFFFIFLTVFLPLISLSSSSQILLLPLTHSLSPTQFNSTPHLLKSTSTRSSTPSTTSAATPPPPPPNLPPLSPSSDYTLSFSLGSNPPQTISLYMDTGSHLVWFPFHPFNASSAMANTTPPPFPTPTPQSLCLFLTCFLQISSCSSAHSSSSLSSSDLCAVARCPLESIEISDCASFSCPPFYYAYGDGSLIARLYTDSLSIPMSSPSLIIRNFTFGCAHSALGEPIGVAGFGPGLLSLPAQLASFSPQLGNQFSYCLVSHSFNANRVRRPSPLILGRYSVDNKQKQLGNSNDDAEFVYTPMLDNPKHPYFYSVGLEAVTVRTRRIPAPESLKRVDGGGDGGMVVDSGLLLLFCHCNCTNRWWLSSIAELGIVVLPRRNYFYEFFNGGNDGKGKRKVGCVMLMNGGDDAEASGPVGTLGNYQQQGFEVVYDLDKRRVGFARRKCASLWDRLNQS
ncbi:putative aspartyl protease [Camellia lanceoleosa]|uniref:Aspartyl protease n=1 Tax=Camellia lanceoleosa TaxID=1840588 RepID=A0ACC0FHJ7_9ERIC|nr:putative aspartyl protease [Camellia lanceoleosa]